MDREKKGELQLVAQDPGARINIDVRLRSNKIHCDSFSPHFSHDQLRFLG